MRVWTTEDEAEPRRFSYWREVLCEAFVALDPVRKETRPGFLGEVRSRVLGPTMQTDIVSHPQFINRRPEEIRRNPVAYYFANFQIAGSCVVRQDGRVSEVKAGDFAIVDSTRPYFLDMRDNWRILSFRIPHVHLAAKLASPHAATARCVSGGAGAGLVAAQFAQALARLDQPVSPSAQDGLGSALNNVVATALGATLEAQDQGRDTWRSALRCSIETFIEENVADPSLSPETIAARFKLSRRTLYNLFEDAPYTISERIRMLRLERCAHDLTRQRGRNVFEVALRWGFNDPSHFSRAFKQRYGVCPKNYQRAES